MYRCIKSIPQRDDIEIFVIDDNSDKDKTPKYSLLVHPHLQIIYTSENKGAGYARNEGLKYAKGKWLVFADSDDYFTDDLDKFLTAYAHVHEDIVYFKPIPENKRQIPNRINDIYYLYNYADESIMKYQYITPWGKLIKRELVEKNAIQFSEVKWGNDAFFMTQVAVLSKSILKTHDSLYVVTEREGSLTHTANKYYAETRCRLYEDIKCYNFAINHSFTPIEEAIFSRCLRIIKDGHRIMFARAYKILPDSIKNKIRKRFTDKLNLSGRLQFHLLFILSHFVPKL